MNVTFNLLKSPLCFSPRSIEDKEKIGVTRFLVGPNKRILAQMTSENFERSARGRPISDVQYRLDTAGMKIPTFCIPTLWVQYRDHLERKKLKMTPKLSKKINK